MNIARRHSFIRQYKLDDVCGRCDYVGNPDRQEHLYATYSTVEPEFWKELAEQNQYDFKRSGSKGNCIEARELVIALPESFQEYDRNLLLQLFAEQFRSTYGVQCTAALHHNKKKTNYHIHLIYSERKVLEKKEIKRASRNMFYDEKGKHVRTKKEILDESGNIRPGCYIVPKGEIYEKTFFDSKEEIFKHSSFLKDVKQMYTLACAAGVAAMKYYKEHDIEGHVAEMHEIVAPFMDEMVKKHKCIGEARCIGLFGALEVVKNKETREPMQEYGVPGPVMPWIFAELKKRGFATFGRENFIEICPPLIITKEELEEYLPILDEVLTMVDEKFCD